MALFLNISLFNCSTGYGTLAEPGIVIRYYPENAIAFVNFNSSSVVQSILKSKLMIIIRGFNSIIKVIKAGDWKFFDLHEGKFILFDLK